MKEPFRNRTWIIATLITIIVATITVHTLFFTGKNGNMHLQVVIDTTELRSGDLLLRNGLGTESRFVTGLSNGEYSHIAIAYKDTGGWYAVHAVPGETPHPKDTDYLKCEPIEEFYKQDRAKAGAIARVNSPTDAAIKAVAFLSVLVNTFCARTVPIIAATLGFIMGRSKPHCNAIDKNV